MRVIGVIQARIGSSRLKNKMMLSLHGKPIIEWVIKRVKQSNLLDEIILAIPSSKENDILEKYTKKFNIEIFRGEEENVLKRFYDAVSNKKSDAIVRICADNPLIAGEEIDNLIEFFNKNRCDYAYNHIPKNNLYPDGLGAEIVPFEILEFLYKNVSLNKHKEHIFSYIWDNEKDFNIKTFNPLDKNLHHPEIKLDVDTFEDYYKLSMKDLHIDMKPIEIVNQFIKDKNENS